MNKAKTVFLRGGMVVSIADVACGYAALTMIPEGREVLVAEFKINLLRSVNRKENSCHRKGTQARTFPGHH